MADSSQRRQRMLLGVLAVMVVTAGWYYRDLLLPSFGGDAIDERPVQLEGPLGSLRDLPAIPIDRRSVAWDYQPKRNLFEFDKSPEQIEAELARRRLERERAQQRKQQEEQRREQVARDQRERPPAQPPAPKSPDFRYTYVGYLGEAPHNYLAVLHKPGASREPSKEDILVVRIGEIIDEKFVIKEIGVDSLIVGFTDNRFNDESKTVKLVEAKQQRR